MCKVFENFVKHAIEQWAEIGKSAGFTESSPYEIGKEGEERFAQYLDAQYPDACVVRSPRSRSPVDVWMFQYDEAKDTITIKLYQVKSSEDGYPPTPSTGESNELKVFTRFVLKLFVDYFFFNNSCVVVESYWIRLNLKEKRFMIDPMYEDRTCYE